MSKGGGGTAGLEEAANRSLELQRQIYEEGIERGEPWYQAGQQGLGTLLDYLGLQGGASQRSERQIRDQLMPQYTTTTGGGMVDQAGLYRDQFGNVRAFDEAPRLGLDYTDETIRYTPVQQQTQAMDVTDTAGLDAAVQAQLAEQQAMGTPDYFGSLLTPFGMDQFEADPSYQFRLDEGNKALERSLAAQGKTFSPEAVKALQGYGQDLASQEYGRAFDRYRASQSDIYNRLAALSGVGQTQAAQASQLGQQYGQQATQTIGSLANAQAAAQQSRGSMFGDLGQLLGTGLQAYAAFSDRDLKENIEKVGEEKGFNIYEFNYKGDDKRYSGVMAQEVLKVRPDAVCMVNGNYAVDYGRLGLEMKEVA